MVGTVEERKKGYNLAAIEYFDKYRKINYIHYLYEQEFRKEIIKEQININKIHILAQELEKICKIKRILEIENENYIRYKTQRKN